MFIIKIQAKKETSLAYLDAKSHSSNIWLNMIIVASFLLAVLIVPIKQTTSFMKPYESSDDTFWSYDGSISPKHP